MHKPCFARSREMDWSTGKTALIPFFISILLDFRSHVCDEDSCSFSLAPSPFIWFGTTLGTDSPLASGETNYFIQQSGINRSNIGKPDGKRRREVWIFFPVSLIQQWQTPARHEPLLCCRSAAGILGFHAKPAHCAPRTPPLHEHESF